MFRQCEEKLGHNEVKVKKSLHLPQATFCFYSRKLITTPEGRTSLNHNFKFCKPLNSTDDLNKFEGLC